MINLLDLANKYGTDKVSHGYIQFYEQQLPKDPKKILEIGCLRGSSLRMWREYFPNAELHTLDLFEEYQPPTDIEGLIAHKGHQADYYILEQLAREDFDIIIDDGSHMSRHQMMTFFGLFKAGCHYFIEDLQCCDEDFYRDGLPYIFTAKGLSIEISDMASSCNSSDFDCVHMPLNDSIVRPFEKGIYTKSPIMLIKC